MIKRNLSCIMLIDNNPDDNFYHRRIIAKNQPSITVLVMISANDALIYLRSEEQLVQPDLIFLDINMPGVNGWEFIEQYKGQKSLLYSPLIVMLTTSENPDDRKKALQSGTITYCLTKPLTADMLIDIKSRFFN